MSCYLQESRFLPYAASGMHDVFRKPHFVLLALILVVLLNSSCTQSGSSNAIADANDSNIKRLSNLYQSFASRNGWRGPKDEVEFKEFIRTYPVHRLQLLGVDPDALDALFTSERDGQTFQIKYEASSGLGAAVAVVFEQPNSDGRRAVGFTDGSVQVVDEGQYQELFNAAR